tara:strand:+ start:446 stop:805 length:360 start_codon:yes stop_codon:yes gene_type:complete
MKIEAVNFSPLVEIWEDPGDYPSNAGQFPLSSYPYLEAIEGDLKVKLESTDGDLLHLKSLSCSDGEFEEHYEGLYEEVCPYVPAGIVVCRWEVSRDGDILSVEASEVEDDGYLDSLDDR